ncbi:hypothetical protein IF2G_01527 [Cordyceps javanica]|nr:hypothetical protein IF2G_01527 [Cordyceps javanica]
MDRINEKPCAQNITVEDRHRTQHHDSTSITGAASKLVCNHAAPTTVPRDLAKTLNQLTHHLQEDITIYTLCLAVLAETRCISILTDKKVTPTENVATISSPVHGAF